VHYTEKQLVSKKFVVNHLLSDEAKALVFKGFFLLVRRGLSFALMPHAQVNKADHVAAYFLTVSRKLSFVLTEDSIESEEKFD